MIVVIANVFVKWIDDIKSNGANNKCWNVRDNSVFMKKLYALTSHSYTQERERERGG